MLGPALQILDTSPHFISLADSIAQLFLDRFRPDPAAVGPDGTPRGLAEAAFQARAAEIQAKIGRLHHEVNALSHSLTHSLTHPLTRSFASS